MLSRAYLCVSYGLLVNVAKEEHNDISVSVRSMNTDDRRPITDLTFLENFIWIKSKMAAGGHSKISNGHVSATRHQSTLCMYGHYTLP